MKILIAGDFCDKYRVTELIRNKEYSKMFGDVKNVVSAADFSFVNFEFPIVANYGKPIPKCGPNLKGQTEAIDAIKWAGFNCCTLANNHILDQGEECLLDTKKRIEKAGIKTVGAGANLSEASEILYLQKDGQTLAVINCCEHEFTIATDTTAGANPLNSIQQYYKIQEARQKAEYVLVIVHGGHEHYQLPSPRMKDTYRFFVDAGADAVINHHQHCYSGYEVYNGKPIFYGLGNFLFDHISHRNNIWNEGFMVVIDFNDADIQYKIFPYIQCAETASVRLMSDKVVFLDQLDRLSSIISNDKELISNHDNFMLSKGKTYSLIFEPYNNRYLNGLYRRGILPSIVSKSKLLKIENFIFCEAHLDCVKSQIKKMKK